VYLGKNGNACVTSDSDTLGSMFRFKATYSGLVTNISNSPQYVALALFWSASAVYCAQPATPWDSVVGVQRSGAVTIKTTDGRTLKASYVSFTDVEVHSTNLSVPRRDVREIVVRRERAVCCQKLYYGLIAGGLFAIEAVDQRQGTSVSSSIATAPPWVIGLVVGLTTRPAVLVIEGVRRLKPAPVLYRIMP
jgi:hypothetical protein